MVYLKSVENVITLGKLIGLLFLFCLPLLSILFLTKRNNLARPVMGTIFLVVRDIYPRAQASSVIGQAKRAPHWGVQSRCRVIYIVGMSYVVCQIYCVGGSMWPTHMIKVFFGWLNQ